MTRTYQDNLLPGHTRTKFPEDIPGQIMTRTYQDRVLPGHFIPGHSRTGYRQDKIYTHPSFKCYLAAHRYKCINILTHFDKPW